MPPKGFPTDLIVLPCETLLPGDGEFHPNFHGQPIGQMTGQTPAIWLGSDDGIGPLFS
jgi:hypothetical protein